MFSGTVNGGFNFKTATTLSMTASQMGGYSNNFIAAVAATMPLSAFTNSCSTIKNHQTAKSLTSKIIKGSHITST